MKTKRDTSPEVLLQRVIKGLEEDNPSADRKAVLALLSQGPLLCSDAVRRELERPDPELVDWRAQLIQFLRTLVRLQGLESTQAQIGTLGYMTFTGRLAGGRVTFEAGGKYVRDFVVLQLVLLLQTVGLRNVRKCASTDCKHLFVKTYRREFCSVRCQARDYKRKIRLRQREEKERQIRVRRRRNTKGRS